MNSTKPVWGYVAGLLLIGCIHYAAFYYSLAGSGGDALVPFVQEIHNWGDLAHSLTSVDSYFEYRPVPYILFSFVLHPLFGTNTAGYHAAAYAVGLAITLLACALVYLWSGRRLSVLIPAAVYLALSPLNIRLSSGLEFLCEAYSLLFYFGALFVFMWKPRSVALQIFLFILAMGSKEHSVVLPAHAALILLSMGTPWRAVLQRTRSLWFVMLLFIAFQIAIRGGHLFPSSLQSDRLAFDASWRRLRLLADGSDFLFSIPKRNWLPTANGIHRIVRIAFFLPWAMAMAIALKRRDRLAFAGALWTGISLLPVIFIHEPLSSRHYQLAMPGMAMLGALAVEGTEMAYLVIIPLLAASLATNVNWASTAEWQTSSTWFATSYLSGFDFMAARYGKSNFYVTKLSDREFIPEIGGSGPLSEFLGKPVELRNGLEGDPVPVTRVLQNEMTMVTGLSNGAVVDALGPGPGSILRGASSCKPVRNLFGGGSNCAILHHGVERTGPEVADAIAQFGDKILTVSQSTFFVDLRGPVSFHKHAVLAANSAGGVFVEIYVRKDGIFRMIDLRYVPPGGDYYADLDFAPGVASLAVLRIRNGPHGNAFGDIMEWEDTDSSHRLPGV